ncbi:hypothetical protein [Burkholderia cepacia]|uniref:hypothetical protein n=1 Tax=Burkholderia cepacia TaxID=292 RepID=UPI00158F4BE3|nr:hypothetical protein [Burkholderia cepacia]
MKIESKARQEVLSLIRVVEKIDDILGSLNNKDTLLLREGFGRLKIECERYINGEKLDFKISELLTGIRQGLREMPQLQFLRDAPAEVRGKFLADFTQAVNSELPGFFDKEGEKARKIIARGKIRNPDEFYLIEFFFEQLHDANPDGEDSAALRRIMDDFEFGGR